MIPSEYIIKISLHYYCFFTFKIIKQNNLFRVIFGKDEEEIHAAARYIAEQVESDKALLMSICLKDFEVSALRTIAKAIKKLRS